MMSSRIAATVLVFVVLATLASAYINEEQDKRAKTRIIEHHSLHPPHLRKTVGADDIPYWSYSGATVVTDEYVRLTPDRQSSIGAMWNTEPLDLPSWEIVVGFRIHSKSGFGADGMALWIVDDIPTQKGGLFGHPHEFHGIGILFDSYDNDRYRDNPAIHILYNPKGHMKEYNAQQDFRGQSMGNCYFDYRNTPKPTLASVRVRFHENTLTVSVSKNAERGEVLCATVTGVELNSGDYFVGFTAETGGISDHHDVHYLHTYPIAGVEYDHNVYEHQPFSHHVEVEQKTYWRAKSPEEEAAEAEAKRKAEAEAKEKREQQHREAEEANTREVERRRVAALEKELETMRKKALEQESNFQKLQEQRERHLREQQEKEAIQPQAPAEEPEESQEAPDAASEAADAADETAPDSQGDEEPSADEEVNQPPAEQPRAAPARSRQQQQRRESAPPREPSSTHHDQQDQPQQQQKRTTRPRLPLRGQKPQPARRSGKGPTPAPQRRK